VNPDFTSTTQAVDTAFIFIFAISLLFLAGITVAMIWFVIRYRRSKDPNPSDKDHNLVLEIVWTVIPTILVGGMFWYGWAGFLALRNVPEGALEVKAIGRMWSWNFEYPNGKSSPKLVVPVGQPVDVSIESLDVLHSFYVPAFRIKRDAVPNMENHVWFNADQAGSYDIFCAEYCGVAHADMISTVEALPQHEFDEWYQGAGEVARDDRGKELLGKFGCLGCHSLDGSRMVGPTLQGIWGREVTVIAGSEEKTLKADEAYLTRAILEPGAEIVKGYPPVMPSYTGQIKDDELHELLEYFRRQAQPAQAGKPDGAALAAQNGCLGCHSEDGSAQAGPTFKGLFGSQRTVESAGREQVLTADEAYLKRAIREPGADVVKGFSPIMPPYQNLSDADVEALIDFLESLK